VYTVKYPYIHNISWRVFPVPYTFVSVNRRNNALQCEPGLHYVVDLRIQTYTEPIPAKYGKRATKYPSIYGYFLQCRARACESPWFLFIVQQPWDFPLRVPPCVLLWFRFRRPRCRVMFTERMIYVRTTNNDSHCELLSYVFCGSSRQQNRRSLAADISERGRRNGTKLCR